MRKSAIVFLLLSEAVSAKNIEGPHVVETQLFSIIDSSSLDAHANYVNISKNKELIKLRADNGEGSLLNIKEEITTDNWAFEFKVKNLVMNDVEKAGMYLWYTDKEVTSGSYKGGNPIFNGFVTGIEFTKDRADIVFSFNYGLDFKNKELQTMRFDHINPLLIDHLEHLIIKIIHTENNFKVEIYDQKKNLLSDTFRIHEPMIMNKGPTRKHFAVTTKYENCPNDVAFDLLNMNMNSRNENENYDFTHVSIDHNQYPRNKSDNETRIAIADLSHFMNYLLVVLGSKSKNNIIEMTMEAKKKLRNLQTSIDSMTTELINGQGYDFAVQEKTLKSKISDLENSLANNIVRLEGMKQKFKTTRAKRGLNLRNILLCGSLAGLLFAVAWEVRNLFKKFYGKSVSGKKE